MRYWTGTILSAKFKYATPPIHQTHFLGSVKPSNATNNMSSYSVHLSQSSGSLSIHCRCHQMSRNFHAKCKFQNDSNLPRERGIATKEHPTPSLLDPTREMTVPQEWALTVWCSSLMMTLFKGLWGIILGQFNKIALVNAITLLTIGIMKEM